MKQYNQILLVILFIAIMVPSYGILTHMNKVDFYGTLYFCGVFESIMLLTALCYWLEDS